MVYETLNIAALWELPLIFSVENNRYAQSTRFEQQHAGELAKRGSMFDIAVHVADGMNVCSVAEASNNAVCGARATNKPQVVYMDTYRFSPHSKGDDYRDQEEIENYKLRDPIRQICGELNGQAELAELEYKIEGDVRAIIDELCQDLQV